MRIRRELQRRLGDKFLVSVGKDDGVVFILVVDRANGRVVYEAGHPEGFFSMDEVVKKVAKKVSERRLAVVTE